MRVEMNLDIQENLREDIDSRIAEFKNDPEKMNDVNIFVDDVLTEAQKNAEVKLQDKTTGERSRNDLSYGAMTMKQLKNSLEMMRKACAPKFQVDEETLDALKAGSFPADPDNEIKCYTVCIAQMAGTLTKKGDLSYSKTLAQIDAMLPSELKESAKEALNACKNARNKLLSGLKQHRVVTRTRGIVLRIFEAICNCTNSTTLPGQRPAGSSSINVNK